MAVALKNIRGMAITKIQQIASAAHIPILRHLILPLCHQRAFLLLYPVIRLDVATELLGESVP